jgi:hypothetical protein
MGATRVTTYTSAGAEARLNGLLPADGMCSQPTEHFDYSS